MDDGVVLKAKLLDLLEQRYQKDPRFFVNKSTISVELGITEEESFRYADYLVNNKWATISEPQTSRWRIMITKDGRKELERIRDVIVDAQKKNTNEQLGDAKLSKIEEKIKDVNLEKFPSEKSESLQRTQKENPKETLQAYLIKLKKAKESRSVHNVQREGERLLEFVKKLQLTYVEFAQLNEELEAMINMSFSQRRSNMLSADQKSLNSLFDEYVADDIDKVIYDVEALIDLPKEISLRKKPLPEEKTKSWFSKLFSSKQKDSQILEESLEIPIDNFQGIFNVFISHKFVKPDQKLALELRKELRKNQIDGYLAESTREYELLIGDKIREAIDKSKFVVAILTKNSQTSASVNQELGYALGIKKPILIMIEKGVEHGVLTHGRDPEEFSRGSFSNHCKPIVDYILNKGKQNSQITPEILREKVYPELYDKMMTIHENPDKFKILTVNPWKDISPSFKLKIEDDIKQLFEEFTSKLSDWHTTLSRVNQNFTINKAKLGEIISPSFAQVSLTKPDGYIILDSHASQQPEAWIDAFKFIIFDEEIINEQILYEKLVKYARDTENGHLRWLQDWKTQKPTLFGHIFDTLPQLREVLRIDFFNEEMQKEKENISILVEKIIKTLEKRIS